MSGSAAFRHIRMEQDEAGVATLTLARPQSLNALKPDMLDEMRAAVSGLADARCLLVTGEGRGFCSGADLVAAAGAATDDIGLHLERHFNPLVEALFALDIPVVAAVNGVAAGAGCSLALAADIAIAARSASFVQSFVRLGLVPDAGATWLLPRLAGRARAMEMMMLGEPVPAERALEWGLIARVADDGALVDEARALAARLAAGPTRALGLVRRLARQADGLALADALAAERRAQSEAGRTRDFQAGVAAFLAREAPRFEGR